MDKQALVNALIESARNHDWFFEYSDDHSAYTAGRIQRADMSRAFCELDDVDSLLSVETWNRIAPVNFHFRPKEAR